MHKDSHLSYEEQFHDDERRLMRKIRKHATQSDRSKFKKTDKDQLEKGDTSPTFKAHWVEGRVISIISEGIQVQSAEGSLYLCKLKGKLKQEYQRVKNLVAIGDRVWVEPGHPGEGMIEWILPRHSFLARAEHLSQKKQQFIAVNIDQVLITVSVVMPVLKSSIVDRYIIAARRGNIHPVIVVNKIDLLQNPSPGIDPVLWEEEKTYFQTFIQTYEALGIPVICMSDKTGEGLEALEKLLQNRTSVFSGQSGTGKTSLLNRVTHQQFAVGQIVEKTLKGSHTTSSSRMIPLPDGGYVIDTPGIKSFGLWEVTKEEIKSYFEEIHTIGTHCRFSDCHHETEPGCAVVEAVEKGVISPLRFASFRGLMSGVDQPHHPR